MQNKLHLHARRIDVPHPSGGRLRVTAPLPPHMVQTWNLFGFDMSSADERLMRLVLFDCDGTLVDSAKLIHEVMARTFVDFGHARPDIAETKAIIGLTLDIAIARMQGKPHVDDEALAMAAHYKAIYAGVRAEPVSASRCFPASPR